MIKAFSVSILSLLFSSVQIAFINENTKRYLEKAGLLKLTRYICIKRGTVPGNTGRMGTLLADWDSPRGTLSQFRVISL
jgi:hypothetical protein